MRLGKAGHFEVNNYSHLYNLPAVDVKQNARPAKHDVPIDPKTPASGRLRRRPMLGDGKECEWRME